MEAQKVQCWIWCLGIILAYILPHGLINPWLTHPLLQYPNELRFLNPEEITALADKIIADSTKVLSSAIRLSARGAYAGILHDRCHSAVVGLFC
jgi:hypothetical protein